MQGLERFFGGNPVRILLKLALVSVIIGVILAALHIEPGDILFGVRDFFVELYNSGYRVIGAVQDYFLLGAVFVFPIWLIWRFLSVSKSNGGKS